MKWNLEIINKVACHYVTHVRVFLRVCVPAKASLAASHLALVAARAVTGVARVGNVPEPV
jgi:hypothetical protein